MNLTINGQYIFQILSVCMWIFITHNVEIRLSHGNKSSHTENKLIFSVDNWLHKELGLICSFEHENLLLATLEQTR